MAIPCTPSPIIQDLDSGLEDADEFVGVVVEFGGEEFLPFKKC